MKRICISLTVFVCSLCLFDSWACGQEAISKLLARCKMERSVAANVQEATLKAYPLRPLSVQLTPPKNAILDAMVGIDSVAVAIERTRRRTGKPDKKQESRFPYFDSPDAPNTVVVIRENVATVFPKMLLFSSTVASKKLKPNDFVATFYAGSTQGEDQNDPIQKWYSNQTKKSKQLETVEVVTTGFLLKSEFRRRWAVATLDQSLDTFLFDGEEYLELGRRKDGEEVDTRLLSGEGSLQSKLVVAVVHRKSNPFNVRIVIPLESAGTFGSDGERFLKLFQIENKADSPGLWRNELSPYTSLPLFDSDIVEITTMELLEF